MSASVAPRPPEAWWTRPSGSAADALDTDLRQGLTSAEAERRLLRDGPNEIERSAPTPAWRRLLRQIDDPLVLLLLAAIVVSLIVWWSEGTERVPVDAIVIAAIVGLNAGIGFWQESRSIDAVGALRRLSATHATVVRDGQLHRVPTGDLVVGDLVALAEGDAVGADCRVVEAASLQVAEAAITGESAAVAKEDGVLGEDALLAERSNMVFAGTAVVRGRGVGVVVATAMDTEVGRIASMLDDGDAPTPLQQQVAWLGRRLGIVVVALSTIVVAAIVLTGEDRSFGSVVDALLVGVSLAVAAVPEGLPAILSVVLALGVQRMARARAIVKQLSSVETLGSASVICTDKTGTLTRNEMTIVELVVGGRTYELTGVGYEPLGHVEADGARVDDPAVVREVALVLGAGSLANDATLGFDADGRPTVHGDPTELAFLVAEQKIGSPEVRRRRYERIAEIPFSSERKRMSTVHRDVRPDRSTEHVLVMKGAPDVVLERCSHERRGEHTVELDDERRAEIATEVDGLADRALRTISVAYRELPASDHALTELDEEDERGLVHLGVVGILDPPRSEAVAALAEARSAGVRTIMLTGDHPTTAARIGQALGLVDAEQVGMTGRELAACDDVALREALRTHTVFARVEPHQKLRIVDALQADGQIVAMTGDGVNDAPALRRADIGVAMGVTGTEVSKEAADMILADDNFATILRAVREGREIFADIRKVLRYLLASNTGEVLVMLLGVAAAALIGLDAITDQPAVPLLATQILWINLLTDGALALALGVDPAVEDVMQRPPRQASDRVIDRDMVVTIAIIGCVSALAALIAFDLRLPGGLVGDTGDIATARTMAFTTLVLGQVFNAFNARSDRVSAFVRPLENRVLWASIGVTVALQIAVVHVPILQRSFDTAALSATDWAIALGLASTVLWVDEIRKLVLGGGRRERQVPPTAATIAAAT